MRTVISGPVTAEDLDTAGLFGIEPTSLVANEQIRSPREDLAVKVYPLCEMNNDRKGRVRQRNYTLCQNADAVVVSGKNPHLVGIARAYGLPVYEC